MSMTLPFTQDQFLEVFAAFNEGTRPAHPFVLLGMLATVACAWKGGRVPNRVAAGLLGLLWFWNGIAFHWAFFTRINPAAYLFGGVFVVQGLLFLGFGSFRSHLAFGVRRDPAGILGALLLAYALIVYPALGLALGDGYPRAPLVGVPCPSTIFTFGILLWARPRVPVTLLVMPTLWALVGFWAALALGIPQDFGLLASALLAVPVIVVRNRRRAAA
jgi:hypothetical protein